MSENKNIKGKQPQQKTQQQSPQKTQAQKAPTKQPVKQSQSNNKLTKPLDFPLSRENFILMGICLGIIILGFILMVAKPENKYTFVHLHLSTILVIFGFLSMIYAIMKKQKPKSE